VQDGFAFTSRLTRAAELAGVSRQVLTLLTLLARKHGLRACDRER
jgi:hypothetical protein